MIRARYHAFVYFGAIGDLGRNKILSARQGLTRREVLETTKT